MKVTKRWIEKHKTDCSEWNSGIEWWEKNRKKDEVEIIETLIEDKQLIWANWFFVRRMKYKQYVTYAIFAAEQVLSIYEQKHQNDDRARNAIVAAKAYFINPSKKNKAAAYAAAYATDAAVYAAYAAYAAADAAAYAAADAAADAAAYAAACAAADAAADAMKVKILRHGIEILKANK